MQNKVRKLRRPRWTKEQVKELRRLYPSHSNEEIAGILGKGLNSVIFKANRLGIYKTARRLADMGRENIKNRWQPKPAAKVWTERDINMLRELYPDTDNAKIAALMGGRDEKSIVYKAWRLKLHKSDQFKRATKAA